jgi:hypothetical protein
VRLPQLRAEPLGVTEVKFQGVSLPPCKPRRCPRCNRRVEMRSFLGGMCPSCWEAMAAAACWRGLEMNAFSHATRR